jgi:hypothetical protein
MHVSFTLVTHVVLVLMVLPKFLSLIPFWKGGPTLVLECYGSQADRLSPILSTKKAHCKVGSILNQVLVGHFCKFLNP